MKFHIFGASGSGTTSLGKSLARDFGITAFDADSYYWKKTDPHFTTKNSIPDRHRLLLNDMEGLDQWVLSGSMDSWSEPFRPLFSAAIFVTSNSELRIQRLREREYAAYGERIKSGGDMHKDHEYFIKWAQQYEKGEMEGRSLKRHEQFIKVLSCPVLQLENNGDFSDFVNKAKKWLSWSS